MRIGHWVKFFAVIGTVWALSAPAAHAQLKLEFGGSTKDLIRSMAREGYTEVQITDTGFSKVRADACFEGSRYSVTVKRFSGQIKRGPKIGECRPIFSEAKIIRRLKRDGYSRISVYAFNGDIHRMVACQRGNRFRMEVNQYGDVIDRVRVGRCESGLNVAEVRQRLRDSGFNRHKLVSQNERIFVFEACNAKSRQYRVRVQRSTGKVVRSRRIGRCTPPIRVAKLSGLMADRGFDRIAIVDRKLPVYAAEGCKANRLVRVKFNRFGDEMKRERVGDCEPPLTREDVVKLIRDGGANRITVEEDAKGNFVATGCYNKRMIRSRFDKYGKLFEQRRTGTCPAAPRMTEIFSRFGKRFTNVDVYVEGCRNGRRIRLQLDQYGDRIGRERVGSC